MFKRIIIAIAAVLALAANVANAQSNTCTDPAAYNQGKSTPCLYLPQVTQPLNIGSCLGTWTAFINNGTMVLPSGGRQYLQPSTVKISLSSGSLNPDGSISCQGTVAGLAMSTANLYYNSRNGRLEVDLSTPEPEMLGGTSMYILHVHFEMFLLTSGNPQNLLGAGTMNGEFQDWTDPSAMMDRLLFHGDVNLSGGSPGLIPKG